MVSKVKTLVLSASGRPDKSSMATNMRFALKTQAFLACRGDLPTRIRERPAKRFLTGNDQESRELTRPCRWISTRPVHLRG